MNDGFIVAACEVIDQMMQPLGHRSRCQQTGEPGEIGLDDDRNRRAGDLGAGEREFRAALTMALEMREREWVSQVTAGLSRLLASRGEHWRAERLSREAIQLVPQEMLDLGADLRGI